MPPDAQVGYLKRYHDSLKLAIQEAGIADQFNILKYSLISAKTSYGVEDLITVILSFFLNFFRIFIIVGLVLEINFVVIFI